MVFAGCDSPSPPEIKAIPQHEPDENRNHRSRSSRSSLLLSFFARVRAVQQQVTDTAHLRQQQHSSQRMAREQEAQ